MTENKSPNRQPSDLMGTTEREFYPQKLPDQVELQEETNFETEPTDVVMADANNVQRMDRDNSAAHDQTMAESETGNSIQSNTGRRSPSPESEQRAEQAIHEFRDFFRQRVPHLFLPQTLRDRFIAQGNERLKTAVNLRYDTETLMIGRDGLPRWANFEGTVTDFVHHQMIQDLLVENEGGRELLEVVGDVVVYASQQRLEEAIAFEVHISELYIGEDLTLTWEEREYEESERRHGQQILANNAATEALRRDMTGAPSETSNDETQAESSRAASEASFVPFEQAKLSD
jgi:hypothetical protein